MSREPSVDMDETTVSHGVPAKGNKKTANKRVLQSKAKPKEPRAVNKRSGRSKDNRRGKKSRAEADDGVGQPGAITSGDDTTKAPTTVKPKKPVNANKKRPASPPQSNYRSIKPPKKILQLRKGSKKEQSTGTTAAIYQNRPGGASKSNSTGRRKPSVSKRLEVQEDATTGRDASHPLARSGVARRATLLDDANPSVLPEGGQEGTHIDDASHPLARKECKSSNSTGRRKPSVSQKRGGKKSNATGRRKLNPPLVAKTSGQETTPTGRTQAIRLSQKRGGKKSTTAGRRKPSSAEKRPTKKSTGERRRKESGVEETKAGPSTFLPTGARRSARLTGIRKAAAKSAKA
ncbi:hypothetical protein Ocin01_11782, partial [Orchesella cincta]